MNDQQSQDEGRRNRAHFLLSSLYQRKPVRMSTLGDKLAAFADATNLALALPKAIREDGTWANLAIKTAHALEKDHLVEVTGEGMERQATLSDDATNPRGKSMSEAELAARQPALDFVRDGAQHSRAEVRSMLIASAALSTLEEIERFIVADAVVDWLLQQEGVEVQNEYGKEQFMLSSIPEATEPEVTTTAVETNDTERQDDSHLQDVAAAAPAAAGAEAETSADVSVVKEPPVVVDDTESVGAVTADDPQDDTPDGGVDKVGAADAFTTQNKQPLVVAGVEIHPVALLFPRPAREQYVALRDDMAKNGQLVRVPTVGGRAIDGLSRLTACEENGDKPILEELDPPPESLTEYVLSLNMNRRHLTSSQKATIAVEAERFFAEEAAARKRMGKSADGEAGGRGRKNPTQTSGEGNKHAGEAAQQAAELVGTNRQYVAEAKMIKEQDPELFKDVQQGTTTLQEAKKKIVKKKKSVSPNKKLASRKGPTLGQWKIEAIDAVEGLKQEADPARLIVACLPPVTAKQSDAGFPQSDDLKWWREWFRVALKRLAEDGSLWCLCNDDYADFIGQVATKAGFHRRAWIKLYELPVMGRKQNFDLASRHLLYLVKDAKNFIFNEEAIRGKKSLLSGDVWQVPRPEFPDQLPLEVIQPVIAVASNVGDLVINPFAGMATAGLAAIENGRNYLGMEANQKLVKAARKRLAEVGAAAT